MNQPRYSAFEKKRNDPLYAAKFDDVNDENYFERAVKHAEAWDRCATLRPNEPGYGAWMAYLERYAPKRLKLALDAVAKRGYYTFPDRHPSDFDIRVKGDV
jgi:hypothetical protein